MCGIFGAIRCGKDHSVESYARTSYAFFSLGVHSEERGTDSSGIALLNTSSERRTKCTQPTKATAGSTTVSGGDVLVVKDTKPFHQLPLKDWSVPMSMATMLIGHTRSATQGDTKNLCNASPILAGSLVGTHNGDIDAGSVPGYRYAKEEVFGDTDSELLFSALNAARGDRRGLTQVLRSIHGRAAVAFIDRTRPDRLYLARAALSPLCYTYDQSGNFYYASNPDWFRRIQADPESGITFTEITMIPEGHLLTIDTLTGAVADVRRFTPICREKDLRIMSVSAYRGYRAEDKNADLALHRHRVVSPPLPKWPSLSPAPALAPKEVATKKPKAKSMPVKEAAPVTPAPTKVTRDTPQQNGNKASAEFEIDWGADIDLQEVEDLCWALGDFDHHTYERILEADDATARKLIDRLRCKVVETLGDYDFEWLSTKTVA